MSHVFVSGNLALDFLGTLKWRRSKPEELLNSPEDLDRWVLESAVLSSFTGCDEESLIRMKELREVIYRLASARVSGLEWDRADISQLNQIANSGFPQIVFTESGLEQLGDVESVAGSVARSGIDLLASAEVEFMKECKREACTRIFVDRSRSKNRHWCGMDECGNRIKAANYRSRHQITKRRQDPIVSARAVEAELSLPR